ncbi:hypothetical protein J3F83DRAFT_641315 [Trichoderma novae-zelandiae]
MYLLRTYFFRGGETGEESSSRSQSTVCNLQPAVRKATGRLHTAWMDEGLPKVVLVLVPYDTSDCCIHVRPSSATAHALGEQGERGNRNKLASLRPPAKRHWKRKCPGAQAGDGNMNPVKPVPHGPQGATLVRDAAAAAGSLFRLPARAGAGVMRREGLRIPGTVLYYCARARGGNRFEYEYMYWSRDATTLRGGAAALSRLASHTGSCLTLGPVWIEAVLSVSVAGRSGKSPVRP